MMVPRLKPRYFSIASSSLAHPGIFQLTVAVVKYRTPWRRPRRGVCSNWLANATPSTAQQPFRIPVWFKKGSLRLPKNVAEESVILIGNAFVLYNLSAFAWIQCMRVIV